MQGKRWCVTVNNYDESDIERIYAYCTTENCKYAIFGKEVGENGTPHLQGFVHLIKRVRLSTIKSNISLRGHYEFARGCDEDNKNYCSKGSDLLLEVGQPAPKHGTNTSYVLALEIADKIIAGESLPTLIRTNEHYLTAYMRHSRCIEEIVTATKNEEGKTAFTEKYSKDLVLYDWQIALYDMLTNSAPSDRLIYWYVDYVGGAGKSTFVNYFLSRHKSVCFFGGKINDLSYAYQYEPVVFFDLSRSGFNDYLMGFIEQMKNGRIFSSKYKSAIKYFPSPHVIVFSNKLPEDGVFSADRLEIKDITN